jgi:hypothetical protein
MRSIGGFAIAKLFFGGDDAVSGLIALCEPSGLAFSNLKHVSSFCQDGSTTTITNAKSSIGLGQAKRQGSRGKATIHDVRVVCLPPLGDRLKQQPNQKNGTGTYQRHSDTLIQ